MSRTTLTAVAIAAAFCAAACDTDPFFTQPTDTSTPATEVTETFDGQLTVNGGVTHPFAVQRSGSVTVRLLAVDPTDVTIGLSLGTWNATSNVCQAILTNDAAIGGATVVGSAQLTTSPGNYCARVYDVGRLSSAIFYSLTVTHF
jgi:hypothetical protein